LLWTTACIWSNPPLKPALPWMYVSLFARPPIRPFSFLRMTSVVALVRCRTLPRFLPNTGDPFPPPLLDAVPPVTSAWGDGSMRQPFSSLAGLLQRTVVGVPASSEQVESCAELFLRMSGREGAVSSFYALGDTNGVAVGFEPRLCECFFFPPSRSVPQSANPLPVSVYLLGQPSTMIAHFAYIFSFLVLIFSLSIHCIFPPPSRYTYPGDADFFWGCD